MSRSTSAEQSVPAACDKAQKALSHPLVKLGAMTNTPFFTDMKRIHQTWDTQIAVNGWVSVSFDLDDRIQIGHTLGLVESYDRPEFFQLGFDPEISAALFQTLATATGQLGEVPADMLIDLGLEVVPVHESWLRTEMLHAWASYYERLPMRGEVLQVRPGPAWQFKGNAHEIPRLDKPTSEVDLDAFRALLEPLRPMSRRERRAMRRRMNRR